MLGLRSARPPAVVAVLAVGALMLGTGSATAGHVTDPRTKNLHPMGHIEEPASLLTGPPTIHTDIFGHEPGGGVQALPLQRERDGQGCQAEPPQPADPGVHALGDRSRDVVDRRRGGLIEGGTSGGRPSSCPQWRRSRRRAARRMDALAARSCRRVTARGQPDRCKGERDRTSERTLPCPAATRQVRAPRRGGPC
jgi:hypothetical protein